MATIRGYITMPALASNQPNTTAAFGEFSTKVETYSRDTQYFANDTLAGVTFAALYSEDNDVHWVIPDAVGQSILTVGKWVYDQYLTLQIPRNISKAAFIVGLSQQFPTMSNFYVNELLAGSATNLNMPDYVRFTTADGHTVQIWFADASIKAQYDNFETHVVPPVSDVAVFKSPLSSLQAAIVSQGIAAIRTIVESIIGENPPTYDTTYQTTWKDPTGAGATLDVTWSVVGYGPMSVDEESIKDSIKKYLTDQDPATDWSTIFPGLYSSSEFAIIPQWAQTSPATVGVDTGSYSPFTLVNGIEDIVTPRLPIGYAAATNIATHLHNYMLIFGFNWRSISLAAVGSPSNIANYRRLDAIVPDLLNVPTTNGDYGRMSANTAAFVEKLNTCLELARTFGPTSVAPNGFTKRITGGRIYLTFNFLEYKIMVLTRYGYNTLV